MDPAVSGTHSVIACIERLQSPSYWVSNLGIYHCRSLLPVHSRMKQRETKIQKPKIVNNFHQKEIKIENFYQKYSRSFTVCLNCRQRKRKCDGNQPLCGRCTKSGSVCEWKKKPSDMDKKGENSRQSQPVSAIGAVDLVNSDSIAANTRIVEEILKNEESNIFKTNFAITDLVVASPTAPSTEWKESLTLNVSPDAFLVDDAQPAHLQQSSHKNWNLIPDFHWGHGVFVDANGVKAIDFFMVNTSKTLSIGPDASNYLIKTFIPLAMSDEVFQYAMASWGSVFLRSGENDYRYRGYMLKAAITIQTRIQSCPDVKRMTKSEFYVLLCFYIIAMSVEICSGDSHYCHIFYTKCLNLIRDYGGYEKVFTDFLDDNDIKWLISNLQYHDVLSSHTALHGSSARTEFEYVFKQRKILDSVDYGIDPFQGCNQLIYLVLSDIIYHDVLLKQEWAVINSTTDGSIIDSNQSLTLIKREFYKKSARVAEKLSKEIQNCQPDKQKLELFMTDNVDQHILLFELIRRSCQLYLMQNIRKIPPSAYDLQALLHDALEIADKLLGTRMMTCMAFPMLVCGMTCTESEDRQEMDARINRYIAGYPTGNTKFVRSIIHEAWKNNPEGNICLNWAEIAHDKGWKFFIS